MLLTLPEPFSKEGIVSNLQLDLNASIHETLGSLFRNFRICDNWSEFSTTGETKQTKRIPDRGVEVISVRSPSHLFQPGGSTSGDDDVTSSSRAGDGDFSWKQNKTKMKTRFLECVNTAL